MKFKQILAAGFAVLLIFSAARAQRAEVTVSLNEAFFGALLDSVFDNFDPPEFPISLISSARKTPNELTAGFDSPDVKFVNASAAFGAKAAPTSCPDSIKILREMNGVRTAVRFRDGKIYAPLAFAGTYTAPFVGCVDFAGWAETNIDLEFDQSGQRLIGRAHVLTVNLNGTGGIGGGLIAKLLQTSLDKRLNPIEIIRLDKLSFGVPVQNAGNIRMRATAARPELSSGLLNLHIDYEFLKG